MYGLMYGGRNPALSETGQDGPPYLHLGLPVLTMSSKSSKKAFLGRKQAGEPAEKGRLYYLKK